MQGPNGVHHLAFSTADIKTQIEFFNEVLGLELVALFPMHGVPGGWHGFMRLDDACYLAFFKLELRHTSRQRQLVNKTQPQQLAAISGPHLV